MNNRIERFLLWACIFQVFSFVAARLLPAIITVLTVSGEGEINKVNALMLPILIGMACSIPLQFVCGAWLKSEADRVGVNRWVWFFTGFLFKFIGVIAFYVYLTYSKNQKVQPVASGQSHSPARKYENHLNH
jgi:hypothetical protein